MQNRSFQCSFLFLNRYSSNSLRTFSGIVRDTGQAALTAMRHCGGLVTTCAVDSLVFKHGAKLNQVVVLTGKVTYVGNTSLEVRVDTYVEEVESGERFAINHAYLILVHVNDDGTPIPIRYGLDLRSEIEQAEWDSALIRAKSRKERYAY